jgi:hypothetical protein
MAKSAQEATGREKMTVLADRGYFNGVDIPVEHALNFELRSGAS